MVLKIEFPLNNNIFLIFLGHINIKKECSFLEDVRFSKGLIAHLEIE